MAIKYLDSKRIRGLGLKDGIKKMNGNTANANAGTSYLVYKQITDLSEGDVVSAALIDILTASDSEMAVGLYSDSSNQPDELLYNGSDKCIGKLSDISAGQGQVSYTTLKVPLDATYTIPSGVTKIWVAQ